MPYKNKELKSANNQIYKDTNRWLLYAKRMMKIQQKTVYQTTYDNIKEYLSPTYPSSLRIIGLLKESVIILSKQTLIDY